MVKKWGQVRFWGTKIEPGPISMIFVRDSAMPTLYNFLHKERLLQFPVAGKEEQTMKGFFAVAAGVIFSCSAAVVYAQQDYPNRPITIVVGWTAGGGADSMTRLLARAATKELGQPIVVQNKPGGASQLAFTAVVGSAPDGYTLGLGSSSFFLIAPNLRKLPYDPIRDSTQIVGFYSTHYGVVVPADARGKNWGEFRDYAKQNPGKLSYGTAGIGTMQHLVFERIAQKEGIKWVHVPFKGANETVTSLLGGHIDAAIQGPTDVGAFIQAGKLRMLLVLNDKRWEMAPDVPHILEVGYDFSSFNVGSIWAPKGLPESIRSKLETAMTAAIKSPEFIEGAKKLRQPWVLVGGKEYTKMLQDRFDGYRQTVKDLDLQEH